ncbi:MAG: EAL domain-containing protein [Solobacterium sp.]|nr:EAL domain-containing protein [Solobacterium sp.]
MTDSSERYVFPEALKTAYESSPLSYVYYQNINGNAVPVLASNGFCDNTGMPREQVLNWLETGMFERMHPDDVGLTKKISEDFLQGKGEYNALFRCRINGMYEIIHGVGKWQVMPDGTKLAVIIYDNITEAREKLISFSREYDSFREDRFYTDPLSGLPNLNYLHEFGDERAAVMRSEHRKPSVIYSDVYSMQSYNNQYGVKEGDELLRLIASVLQERFPGGLVIRGSNDHFIVITDLDKEHITETIEEADKEICRRAYGNTSGLRWGICEMDEKEDVTDTLDHARHALRSINNDMTKIWAFFSQEEDERYWRERYIIEHFDRALEHGWIKVFYQGICRTKSGKVTAMEALARWIDPTRGMISPGEFIPVLQRYHQIYKLDIYIMEQVMKEIPLRQKANLSLVPISVNFSRQDFDHVDVPETIDQLYETYGLSDYIKKSKLIVEITEQDMAVGEEHFRKQLARIRECGYGLWLDDFGSGYSAINMFSQFTFDLVKFDMELLRHLDDGEGINRIILRQLVNFSKQIGIHTLAEGLETEEQLEFMKEIGCDLLQGFYFYRPTPLDEILYRLQNGQKQVECETDEERDENDRAIAEFVTIR